jgi:GT2 family glycosyltransferase
MADLFVSVVIGSDPALIQDCIRSLIEASGNYNLDVCVIANDGKVPSGPNIERFNSAKTRVRLQLNKSPLGFAKNHNRALRDAVAEFYLIANDDLVFHDRSVEIALNEMKRSENARVAALSPRLENEDGSLQRSTYGFPTVFRALLDLSGARGKISHNDLTDFFARLGGRDRGRSRFWAHDHVADVDTFRGAAMFVRADAWRDVGEFCELARVGGEIAEWHRRCHDKGWLVRFFPGSVVTHLGSRTVGHDRLLQAEYLKGYVIFFARHSRASALTTFRVAGVGISLTKLAAAKARRDRVEAELWRRNVALLSSVDWLRAG